MSIVINYICLEKCKLIQLFLFYIALCFGVVLFLLNILLFISSFGDCARNNVSVYEFACVDMCAYARTCVRVCAFAHV